ncbi:MAG: pyrroline-5-carboxylate reductase [Sphingobium sp.]|uniref:pyrroline-5-carboxylate reductase n=1 Tax=Sphingobium sp. TaxID=1912891 RepID=UPI0029BF7892|nr:pyrroline-5-carboxylate reductase [Sphingobium sp.]MDX3908491.1 pyrroline-5-carboxylate reductase [Sphingobium sp.]
MTQQWPKHLFMIGCGNMGGAMLSRWIACGLDPANVTVFRPSGKPAAPGVQVVSTPPLKLPAGTVVMLAMKPQQIGQVAATFGSHVTPEVALISILAGIKVDGLRHHFPSVSDVVRIMPNTPVAVGEGVCALYADESTSPECRAACTDLMRPLGLVEWIADEDAFNLVTALSGCGPAYLFRFIDALAGAAEELGLERSQAERLALATVGGAATLAGQSENSPGVLAEQVASPGGMTRKGMDVLDDGDALKSLLRETLRAARNRGIELAGD